MRPTACSRFGAPAPRSAKSYASCSEEPVRGDRGEHRAQRRRFWRADEPDAGPSGHGHLPGQQTARYSRHQDQGPGIGGRQEAVDSEAHRPRPSGQYPGAPVASRRRRLRPSPQKLPAGPAAAHAPVGPSVCPVGQSEARQADLPGRHGYRRRQDPLHRRSAPDSGSRHLGPDGD